MTESSPRPALDELHGEQKRLSQSLLDGFDTWPEVYGWMHDVMVYSAGRVDRRLIRSVVLGSGDKFFREALLLDEPKHRHVRQSAVVNEVVPSFRRGLKELRWKATEYGENPPDSDRSEHIVLRPAYDSLASKQKDVIERGLSPFEDRPALIEWVQDAQRASLGEIPDDFGVRVGFRERHALESFVEGKYTRESPKVAAFTRFLVVGSQILVRFNDPLLKQARRASEQSVEVEEEPTTYELEEELLRDDPADGGG